MHTLKELTAASAFFLVSLVFIIGDLIEDYTNHAPWDHLIEEGIMFVLIFGGVLVLWSRYLLQRKQTQVFRVDLDKVRTELKKYKEDTRSLTEGLSLKIDKQLESWHLTKAEKEVALLLLKGLSNKEMAAIRESSEKTIQLQASSVYQKSHLASRSELLAFFLEDILVLR